MDNLHLRLPTGTGNRRMNLREDHFHLPAQALDISKEINHQYKKFKKTIERQGMVNQENRQPGSGYS
jgi:hypothetical protein